MDHEVNRQFAEWVQDPMWQPSFDTDTESNDGEDPPACPVDTESNDGEDPPACPVDTGIVDSLPLEQDLPCSIRGRFYKAVIAIWLMQESCQLLKMTKWETQTQLKDAARELRRFSPCTTNFAIAEDVDTLRSTRFSHELVYTTHLRLAEQFEQPHHWLSDQPRRALQSLANPDADNAPDPASFRCTGAATHVLE